MNSTNNQESKVSVFSLEFLKIVINVSRPLYIFVILVGFAYCLQLAEVNLNNPLMWIQILWLTIPTGVIVFGLNDIYDYPSDIKNPRKGGKWGAVLYPKYHKPIFNLAAIFSVIFVVITISTLNTLNIISSLLLLLLAWAYSVPPARLKTRPPMEFIVNLAGIFTMTLIAFSWGSGLSGFYEIIGNNIIIAQIFWGLGIAMLAFLADFEEDRIAGDLTTVHWLGKRKSIILACLFYIFAAVLTITNDTPIFPITFLGLALLNSWLLFNGKDEKIKKIYHLNWYIGILSVVLSIFIS